MSVSVPGTRATRILHRPASRAGPSLRKRRPRTWDSQRSTRVHQYAVPGLAYRPQECTDANWRRPTLQTRPGIPGGRMPVRVPGTGIPAYCSGAWFAQDDTEALRTTTDVRVLRCAQDDI